MGAFYTSLHVYGAAPDVTRQAVADAVCNAVTASGHVTVSPDAEEPDHTVLVGGTNGTPWTSIFDETIDQDEEGLAAFANELSVSLKTWVVGFILHDGDLLIARLHRNGVLVDTYKSAPAYFGRVTAKEAKAVAGRALLWKHVLADGVRIRDLRDVFAATDPARGEELAMRFVDLLALDPPLALNSYRYLTAEEEQREIRARLSPLRFTRVPQKADPGRSVSLQLNPHALKCDAGNGQSDGEQAIGDGFFSQVGVTVAGEHALTDGFEASLSGTAIERGIMVPSAGIHAAVVCHGGLKSVTAALIPDDPAAPKLFRARFGSSALPVPKGWGKGTTDRAPAMNIGFTLYGRFAQLGDGEARLRVIPREHPEGFAERVYRLRVVPKPEPGFPRTAITACTHSRLLRLRRPRICSALVFAEDRGEERSLLLGLAERWMQLIQPLSRTAWTLARGEHVAEVPERGKAPTDHEEWQAAKTVVGTGPILARLGGLRPTTPATIGAMYSPVTDGLCLGTPFEGELALGLWMQLEAAPDERAERLQGVLVKLLDEAATVAGFKQAFIARWDWGPVFTCLGEPTLYEEVVLSGARRRKERITGLRAVTEAMWLGPHLSSRLPVRAVEKHAEVAQFGDATRLLLRAESWLENLEEALAPLLWE